MRCPHCKQTMTKDQYWQPDTGFDPTMRRYECYACHIVWYVAMKKQALRDTPEPLNK